MGSCTRRHFLLTICTFQLITIIERQVFDFLGFMWAPILANFFHIICVIFGFFGCYQFRAKYIVTYAIWNLFWIGWNALLVCFYLSVGVLDKDSVLLNFGSVSWFESNGFGCQPVFSTNLTADVPVWPIRPERVDNCLLSYEWVEIGHSGVQLALSVLALLGSILITKMFYDEDDRFDFVGGNAKSPQHTVVHPMYVSYSCIPSSVNSTLSPKRTNTLTFSRPPPRLSATANTTITTANNDTSAAANNVHHDYGFTSTDYTSPYSSSSLNKSSFASNTNYLNTNHAANDTAHSKFQSNFVHPLAQSTSPPPPPRVCDSLGGGNQQRYQRHADPNRHNIRYTAVAPADKLTNDGGGCGGESGVVGDDPYIKDFDSQGDLAIPPHNYLAPQAQHRLTSDTIDNYEMPKSYPYVTRSPLRTRASLAASRQTPPQHHLPANQLRSPMNFVDQIREPPPGYRPVQVMRMGSMPRTKSHDRIAQRRQQQQQQAAGKQRLRPRSYCSNIVSDSFMNA